MIDIVAKIREAKEKRIQRYVCKSNRASSLGEDCVRRLVYERTAWKDKLLHDVGLQGIFDDGNALEKVVIDELSEAGIEVIHQQTPFGAEQLFKDRNITGKVDGMIRDDDGELVPIEIKSMNENIARGINTLEDMQQSNKAHIRKYVTQLALYMLANSASKGVFVIKSRGIPKAIWVHLDDVLDVAEEALKKAEAIERHLKAETLPDRIEDRDDCGKCPFRHLCLPDQNFDSMAIIDDAELLELVENHQKLKPYASAYEKADEMLKKFVESREKGDYMVAGKWLINISEYLRTIYEYPEELKKQYAKKVPTKRKKIINLDANAKVTQDADTGNAA